MLSSIKFVFISVIFVVARAVNAIDLPSESKPMITNIKEIQLGVSAQPNSIAKQSDGIYTIVGAVSAKRQAFAMGVSVDGEIKWSFRKDILNDDITSLRNNIAVHPEYYDNININGFELICGRMGRPRGSNASALVTILDNSGRLIEDRIIDPSLATDQSPAAAQVDPTTQRPTQKLTLFPANIYRCATWGDGVILIGSAGSNLWVTRLSAERKIQWQQVYARAKDTPDPALSAREISVNTSAERAIISFTDNTSSEILIINPAGYIKSRTTLPGRFIALENTKPGVVVKLIGRGPAPGLTPQMASLNELTGEVALQAAKGMERFAPQKAFYLSDGSIALFGSQVSGSGSKLTPAVLRLNPDLSGSELFGMPSERAFYGATISAVYKINDENAFVFATSLSPMAESEVLDEGGSGGTYGLSLNLISFN